ncbi:MAG: hypothetical protein ACI3ZD_07210 [Prevotella sp.]
MEIKRMEGVELTLVNQNSPKNESKEWTIGVYGDLSAAIEHLAE